MIRTIIHHQVAVLLKRSDSNGLNVQSAPLRMLEVRCILRR
jgi:hypothetical protein